MEENRFSSIILSLLLLILQGVKGGSEVKYLPGFEGPLPFQLETGYIGVDEGDKVQLFYYFVKSGSKPETDPLILWLTGGPGCSALTGLVYEIGPMNFKYDYDGSLPTLILNPYAWTEVASILFVDLPVGTGFSYGKTPEAYHCTGMQSCHQIYQFLQKWLADHPEFISNPFYVGGDSYVGITLPVIVQMISDGNEIGTKPHINLQGYLLGNPITFPDENNYKVPYSHAMGLVSDELYQSLKTNCRGNYKEEETRNLLCQEDLRSYHKLVDDLNGAHILEPVCAFASPRPNNVYGQQRRYLYDLYNDEQRLGQLSSIKCRADGYRLSHIWANDASVQEALHIEKGSIDDSWKRCQSLPYYSDGIWDSTPYHANLSTKGYTSLIFSGDHDMLVPFTSTQAWIRSLHYPIIDDWRQWLVQGQIAGYTRTYANRMTFATVKGGGHTAPEYRPPECAAMFKRWISNQPL